MNESSSKENGIRIHLPEIRIPLQFVHICMNILGSVILAFGVCAFIMPYNMIVGGATGISLIVHRIFGVNVSLAAYAINLIVLPIGWFFGGRKLVLGSILSSLVYPTALMVFERMPGLSGIADTAIMAAICGSVVCGTGIGLVMKSGGSTGGMDIPALIIHKLTRIPVGSVMNATDTCIMLGQIPISGLTAILYGILYTYLMTRVIDRVLALGEDRLRFTVVSEKYDEVRRALIENDFGVTMVYAESGYTHTELQQLESVMRSSHSRLAQRIIESVDPEAFITIENVRDVKGRGFTMERIPIELDD